MREKPCILWVGGRVSLEQNVGLIWGGFPASGNICFLWKQDASLFCWGWKQQWVWILQCCWDTVALMFAVISATGHGRYKVDGFLTEKISGSPWSISCLLKWLIPNLKNWILDSFYLFIFFKLCNHRIIWSVLVPVSSSVKWEWFLACVKLEGLASLPAPCLWFLQLPVFIGKGSGNLLQPSHIDKR